jgi:hypothetical protein
MTARPACTVAVQHGLSFTRTRRPFPLVTLIVPTHSEESVESSTEASGFLVVPLVFKTRERRAASLAGSIPVRLRHQH